MQNKTVRPNVFETNSSSTNACALYLKAGAVPDFKPFSNDGKISIRVDHFSGGSEEWNYKLSILGTYALVTNQIDKMPIIEKAISEFTGMEMTFDEGSIEQYISDGLKYPKVDMDDDINDTFYEFLGSYYGNSLEDFKEIMQTVLSCDKMIVAFVCSTGWFHLTAYYDG
jgi:hypothetical protein